MPSIQVKSANGRLCAGWKASLKNAEEIFLVGDIFDFWFEYSSVVPRGYTRLFGKIAELTDAGIPIHFFTGNHDMWMFRYLEEEIGVTIHRKPISIVRNEKSFFIGHGDGLGPGDHGYKFIKRVFANPICIWLFARLHPNLGTKIAQFWSGTSRSAKKGQPTFLGEKKEMAGTICSHTIRKPTF